MNADELQEVVIGYRSIRGTVCPRCNGWGVITYGSTSTYHGCVGVFALTRSFAALVFTWLASIHLNVTFETFNVTVGDITRASAEMQQRQQKEKHDSKTWN